MRTGPRKHSVWLDVFGVLLLGTVLMGGVGYLFYHAGGAATGPAGNALQQRTPTAPSTGTRSALPRQLRPPIAGRSPSAPSPALGPQSGSSRESAAPFSKSWRQQATPDLTGPTPESGGRADAGDGTIASSGPAIASSRPSGRTNGVGGDSDRDASSWQSEARLLANQSRALSRQLEQMAQDDRSEKRSERASSPEESNTSTAGAQTNDRDVPPPPEVPVGGAEWLAAAGAAYALNRLRKHEGDGPDDEEDPS